MTLATNQMIPSRGERVVMIAGISGVGKRTIVNRLEDYFHIPVWVSVSVTTRTRRVDEKEGVDYHFRTASMFKTMIHQDEFLEIEQPHNKDWYGTPIMPLTKAIERGELVVLEINVDGVVKLKQLFPLACYIFINTSNEEMTRRLFERYESLEDIRTRTTSAERERDVARRIFPPENILESVLVGTNDTDGVLGIQRTTELVVERIKTHSRTHWDVEL